MSTLPRVAGATLPGMLLLWVGCAASRETESWPSFGVASRELATLATAWRSPPFPASNVGARPGTDLEAQDHELVEVITYEGAPFDGELVNSFAMPSWDKAENEFALNLGVSWWDHLPDQQPHQPFPTSGGFGRQDAAGFALALGYRRRVADLDAASLWLGADFGLMSHAEHDSYNVRLPDGEVVDDDVTAEVLQLTLGARLDVPVGPVTVFVGGGGGLYNVSFSEDDDYYYWSEEIIDDSELGGYVQLGLDFPVGDSWSLRIEDRMHLVDFDGMDRFTPGNDELSGPIHTFLVGVGMRF